MKETTNHVLMQLNTVVISNKVVTQAIVNVYYFVELNAPFNNLTNKDAIKRFANRADPDRAA